MRALGPRHLDEGAPLRGVIPQTDSYAFARSSPDILARLIHRDEKILDGPAQEQSAFPIGHLPKVITFSTWLVFCEA